MEITTKINAVLAQWRRDAAEEEFVREDAIAKLFARRLKERGRSPNPNDKLAAAKKRTKSEVPVSESSRAQGHQRKLNPKQKQGAVVENLFEGAKK